MTLIEELLEKEKKEFDFRNTFVYKVLDSSTNFKEKYDTPERIWVEPRIFLNLYLERIKEDVSSMDSDFWNMVFGYEGSGKSSLSLMIFSLLCNRDLKKIMANSVFLQTEYAKLSYYFNKHNLKKQPILIDDAHYIFGKYNTLTKETLATLQLARFIRDQQILHITNTQSPTQLYSDIWFERVNNYIYTFKIKKMLGENLTTYRMYACIYLDSSTLKARMEEIRNVGNWKFIISHFPPDMITRFDLLFDDFKKEYEEYKKVKNFYKQFYSYFRYKGIVKGEDYEALFRMLYKIVTNQPIEPNKKFEKLKIIDKKGNVLDKEIENIALSNKDVIITRMSLLEERK